ncbi:MAG: ribonuclease Z [Promethearchaeota archaeon Loki_b31]|nr:MAG: ribonuclease Z [Candidatus Lokiarchaeota archaeon Loki_b31]
MELIILGSSAAIPVRERNLPSTALKYKNELFLFDCGEDLQRRLIEAGLKFNKPLKILISHFHGDHIIGLPGLLFRFGLIERTAPVTIFGPRNLFLYLFVHRKILGLKANYPISIVEIDNDNNKLIVFETLDSEIPSEEKFLEDNVIFENDKYTLKYTEVDHSVLTFAYSFVEKPRYGKFKPKRAIELGIPESKLWKKLQEGEIIEYEGKTIDPLKEGIVGPKRPGRKVTYSGDTIPCESLIELGRDSDILIHEATFSKELSDVAFEKKHSTSVDAANDAKKMNAKQLILTHISSRYQEDANQLLQDAKLIFPNTILAKDLMRISLQ